MQVEFLGTAGYHPNDSRETSCIFLPNVSPAAAFILDAGSGMHRLVGANIPPELHIFISHAHLDHVIGLTFLLDILHGKKCDVTLYGSPLTVDVICNDLFDSPLFPMPFGHNVKTIEEGQTLQVAGADVSVCPLTHPGGSLAYRFDWPKRSLAYVTDTAGDGRYAEFVHDVDLLIHERNFSDALHELADVSGHCTTAAVARVAKQAHAGKLVLTHFNPVAPMDPAEEDSSFIDFPNAIYAHDKLVVEV